MLELIGWSSAGIVLVLVGYRMIPTIVPAEARNSFPGFGVIWNEFDGHMKYYGLNVWATLLASSLGLLGGGIGGLVGGVLAGTSSRGYFLLTPLAVWLKATPIIALSPFFALLLTGNAFGVATLSAAAICFFPVFVNVAFGLREKSSPELEYFLSLKPSRSKIFYHIELPKALGFAIAGTKTASTLAVVGATVGEFIGARRGIGFVVIQAQHHINFARLMLGIVFAGLVGVGFYVLIAIAGSFIARRLFPGIAEDLRRR